MPDQSHHHSFQRGGASPLLLGKTLIAVLLVLWIALSLSKVLWRLLPQPQLNDTVTIDSRGFAPTTKAAAAPAVDIAALKAIPLFGKEVAPVPVAEQTVTEPEPEKLEATKLNLELVGSFASEDQEQAYAIIAKGKKQELYRVKEEVAGLTNVKLTQVYADKVVLNNRGRQEVLYMYPEGKPITSSSAAISPALLSSSNAAQPRAASVASLNANQRLEKISDAIRFSRKTQDGKMIGFRVLPGRNRAAFEQTGLQLNDVVTAIDGQALDNLKTANQVYQQKRNATQANLTVLRGQEELTIDIDLNNININ